MAIYIIFKNTEMKGYLQDEKTARDVVSKWADQLTDELKETSGSMKVRVFRENTENGVKIYTQALGEYLNGAVVLKYVIEYLQLSTFSIPKTSSIESVQTL